MNNPLVTVITVVFNGADTLGQTIHSIVYQSYRNIEYIIIDGGSLDGSLSIIKKYERDIAYWISEPDKGIYDAMNKGIERAGGEWICFMNSGDWFYDENVLKNIFGNSEIDADIIYGNTPHNRYNEMTLYKALDLDKLRFYMPFCHQSSFIRSDIMKKYRFDPQYEIAADYNLFYHLYRAGAKFKYLDMNIAVYDIYGISEKNSKSRENEYRRIQNNSVSRWRFRYEVLKKRFYYDIKNRLRNG
ncbi:MAG: glycosyltransferase [Prevotellaceae bacterium]|jgi:glycosyltransferase involved in cell wall biosynthesis|nr:glycosyltransferase [Prevotellaceae bacterium]